MTTTGRITTSFTFGAACLALVLGLFVLLAPGSASAAGVQDHAHHHGAAMDHADHHGMADAAQDQDQRQNQPHNGHDGDCHCVSALCAQALPPSVAGLHKPLTLNGFDRPDAIRAVALADVPPLPEPPEA